MVRPRIQQIMRMIPIIEHGIEEPSHRLPEPELGARPQPQRLPHFRCEGMNGAIPSKPLHRERLLDLSKGAPIEPVHLDLTPVTFPEFRASLWTNWVHNRNHPKTLR